MLIRWATNDDMAAWASLAENVADIFGSPQMPKDKDFHDYMESKTSKYEALIAVDRMTGKCLGIIGFSRAHNRISWFGVFEEYRGKGIGTRLLQCALNQLDNTRDITVVTFREGYSSGVPARTIYRKFSFLDADNEITDNPGNPRCMMVLKPTGKKRGGSFHYNYRDYAHWSNINNCPVCNNIPSPYPPTQIAELGFSWVECYPKAQGRLFGKCHVLSKVHSEHFYDMSPEDMANFMGDVQKAAKALHKVTGAIKINYEIHGNSMPHLHVHLFPRYLDDDFPSAPIDYRLEDPSPYESEAEYNWFVQRMRDELEMP